MRLNPKDELPPGTQLQVPKLLEAASVRTCTDGPWSLLAADLHSSTVPAPPLSMRPSHYTVARIVRRHGCSSIKEVARLNHLRAPHYAIRVGELTLPTCRR